MKIARHVGTLQPVATLLLGLWAWYSLRDGSLVLERFVVYSVTLVALALAVQALFDMIRLAAWRPSIWTLETFYQKAFIFVVCVATILRAADTEYPGLFPWVTEGVIWVLLVTAFGSIAAASLVFRLGARGGWLHVRTDAVPFRPLWGWWKERRRRGRRG